MDEISAGFRLTTGGAHLVVHKEIPDIAVFSKALGNGYPIAAVIGKAVVMEAAQNSFISSTCWTERIGPTAAIATLEKHRNLNVAKHLIALGEMVQKGWHNLAERHGLFIHVGGMKPMSHYSFEGDQAPAMKAYFIQLMLEQGFLASNMYYAMYAHTVDHVKGYLAAADSAMGEIADAVYKNKLGELLQGKPSGAGFKRLA
jgi:glutamate-1-semialdehyde 2,1-aminomutase